MPEYTRLGSEIIPWHLFDWPAELTPEEFKAKRKEEREKAKMIKKYGNADTQSSLLTELEETPVLDDLPF